MSIWEDLSKILDEEKEAIIEGKVDLIEEILRRKENLLRKIIQLEKGRTSEFKTSLSLIEEIKRKNERNFYLIKYAIDFTKKLYKYFVSLDSKDIVYLEDGDITKENIPKFTKRI